MKTASRHYEVIIDLYAGSVDGAVILLNAATYADAAKAVDALGIECRVKSIKNKPKPKEPKNHE